MAEREESGKKECEANDPHHKSCPNKVNTSQKATTCGLFFP